MAPRHFLWLCPSRYGGTHAKTKTFDFAYKPTVFRIQQLQERGRLFNSFLITPFKSAPKLKESC